VPLFELSHNETTTPSNTMKSFTARVFRKPSFSLLRRKKNKKKAATTKKTPSALEDLPAELKQHVASFLSLRDLLNLDETSKSMKRDLGIAAVSSPLTDLACQNMSLQTPQTAQSFLAVIPNQESSFSKTTFSCHVVTRGFDAAIWIVERDLPENRSPEALNTLRFNSGNVVARAPPTRVSRKLALPFYPKSGKFYQFWIFTTGFRHSKQLRLHTMTLRSVSLAMKPYHTAFQFEVRLPIPCSVAVR